jgi:hypothetical protein
MPELQRAMDLVQDTWVNTLDTDAYGNAQQALTALRDASRVALYCQPCRTNHKLGIDELERLIYALSGLLLDAQSDEPAEESHRLRTPDCWEQTLAWTSDPEAYAEHIASLLEARRKVMKEEGSHA